jgi:hypothetical protein
MSQAAAAMPFSHNFDDQNIKWYPLGEIEHMMFSVCDLDVPNKLVDFIVKFAANERIVMHRHLAHTNTFVVQGEHRLYEPNGELKEVRPVGSYTSSPPGEPHYEGSGAQECIVMYSIRGDLDGQIFEIMDDEANVVAILGMDDFKAAFAEQKGA